MLDNKNYTDQARYFKINHSSETKKSKKIFYNRTMNQTHQNEETKNDWQNIYQTLSD